MTTTLLISIRSFAIPSASMTATHAPAPRIQMKRMSTKSNTRRTQKTLSDNSRSTNSNDPKTKKEQYGSIILPKILKVICIANNEAEKEPKVPRKGSPTYVALVQNGMIKNIEFRRGPENYCLGLIRDNFRHLSLSTFRIYMASSYSLDLTPFMNPTDPDKGFDAEQLFEYLCHHFLN